MNCDLHNHTFYSDGCFSPAELVQAAAERGIGVLAITDHDNLGGYFEAVPLAQAAGIDLLPGIELTTQWARVNLTPEDKDVDLLAYAFDPENAQFQAMARASLADIHERIAWVCGWLTQRGHPLRLDDVFAENPRYAGVIQLIHALITVGQAADWDESFALAAPGWTATHPARLTLEEAIEQIHHAGGKAVLAHPTALHPGGSARLKREQIAQLVEMGIDGIEIYHPRVTGDDRAYFLQLAQAFRLLTTGGSDTHGWHEGFDRMGVQPVTLEMVNTLRQRG